MKPELIVTLGILVLEVILLIICRIKLKQPANPARPRLLPYGAIMLFLFLGFMATAAHTVSLVTGHQVMPRTGKAGAGR